MNEMIKGMSLALLEEAQEIANNIDLDHNSSDVYEQLDEINTLMEKAKTGILKII